MHERIVKILIYVLNEARRTNKPIGEIDLAPLERKGFSTAEISTAFSWLFDRLRSGGDVRSTLGETGAASFRILHPMEQYVLTPEAFGYLLQLKELEILDEVEFETVIERTLMSGFERLGVDDIQDIIASVLFEKEDTAGKMMFDSNDTVQ
jgi:uncharacterized protein Smg (DUF494 family)